MFVTEHAQRRLRERFSPLMVGALVDLLDGTAGELGTVAYIAGTVPVDAKAPVPEGRWWEDSNGDVVVAVARDGSVETVFYRRSTQDMSASFFGARKVVDLRIVPVYAGGA